MDAVSRKLARSRLNLAAIEDSLREVEEHFLEINASLNVPRQPMDDDLVANMVASYATIEQFIRDEIDLFAMGNLKHWLELNSLVLCGCDKVKSAEFAPHLKATEQRFYEEREGVIEDIMDWYDRHRGESVWKRAAGLYVRILSRPQLFIEGNHRCGALTMSYLLVREKQPPFVLSVANAAAFFNPSSVILDIHKQSVGAVFKLPGIKKRFAKFLKETPTRAFSTAD